MRHRHSNYMQWAKTQSQARFNLATSGVGALPVGELTGYELEVCGDSAYGHPPLQRALAEKCGVDPACVVAAAGTSMANHLAMAALLESGDQVLIERPAYELLVSTALYLGADVKRFERREENGFAVEAEEVQKALTPATKLIVITNLHNPTSVLTPDAVLREIGALARSVGARVLVDEVYLDAVYEDTPRTSFHLGPEFVVTNSLTKVYGLSGLRCGWILAEPDIARAMWLLNDLYGSIPAHPAEVLGVVALRDLRAIRERGRKIVEADRALLTDFLDAHEEVSAVRTAFGTTSLLKLKRGDAEGFLEKLRAKYETSAVPGRFFETPDHFRIGMGVDSKMFAEGLQRLGSALGARA